MSSLSVYAENALLNHVFENSAYTPPSQCYMALHTGDPGTTFANEVSGGGYSRTAINFSAAATRKVVQNGQVTFPQCTSSWGTITWWSIADASTSGNMLASGQLATSIQTFTGNVPFIPNLATEISINTGGASNYLAHALLDFMFRNVAYSQPNVHVGLCSAAPTDSSTGSTITELTGGAYARVDFNDWTSSTASTLSNNTEIVFPTPTANWTTVTHVAILDAATAGNLLVYTTATPNQAPLTGDKVSYAASGLVVNAS